MKKNGFTPHCFPQKKQKVLFKGLSFKNMKNGAGFTLIELLAVITIVIIITATAAVSYYSMRSQFSLLRSVHQLSQEIRRIQEMGTSSREVPNPNNGNLEEVPEGGFGIYLNTIGVPPYYQIVLFADFDNDQNYDAPDERLEDVSLERGVIICSLSGTPLKITFQPPNPKVNISAGTLAEIELCLEADASKKEYIKVNEAGLIYVE